MTTKFTACVCVDTDPSVSPEDEAHGVRINVGNTDPAITGPGAGDFVAEYALINSSAARTAIWASNPIAIVESAFDATAWGMEVNVNNHASEVSNPDATLKKVGIDIVAGGTKRGTAALRINAGGAHGADSTNWWYRGIDITRCVNAGIRFRKTAGDTGVTAFGSGAIVDDSDSAVSLLVNGGTHYYGVDLNGSTFTANAIRVPNTKGVVSRNAANNADFLLIHAGALNNVTINGNSVADTVVGALSAMKPLTDNSITCGSSVQRWSAVWAANGTIQTSDARLKTNIMALPSTLAFVNAVSPCTYSWKDGGRGESGKRTHWGFLAQDIKAGMDKLGMDFGGYVCGKDGTESLRPDQLIPVLWKAVQELSAKVDALEGSTK